MIFFCFCLKGRISADSPRLPNASNGNVRSPSSSSTLTSPEREKSDGRSLRSPSLSPMLIPNPDSLSLLAAMDSTTMPETETPSSSTEFIRFFSLMCYSCQAAVVGNCWVI
ncbi:hypothetical protein V6Z11_A08G261900 [Gossypium hirsutum]|uniref:Uncharacterized protein n=1 Tax=Gossypium hirsutum TaxID=3635 RepID=A0ABM3B9C3_GOSHI|nr:uncharacterized protein LOC121224415 [Gossypium hirsutum]